MNLLESIYCYFHNENTKMGRPISYNPKSSTMIIALCLGILPIGLLYWLALFLPDGFESIDDLLTTIFGRESNKLYAILSLLSLFLIIYPVLILTIGTQENYEKVLENYINLPKQEQDNIAKKGRNFFGFSLLFFGIPIFMYSIITAFSS